MVMVKRIRKSELDETWMIYARAEIDGIEHQGPVQKLEKFHPLNIEPHFQTLAPYIVIQYMYFMTDITYGTAEEISLKLAKLIEGFTNLKTVTLDEDGMVFLTNVKELLLKTLPTLPWKEPSGNGMEQFPTDVKVELIDGVGNVYELQTNWDDVKAAFKICNIAK